MKNNKQM